MRLENTANETAPLRRIRVPGTDEFVDFNDEGKARTTRELGEILAEEYEHIEITDREASGGSDEESGEQDAED